MHPNPNELHPIPASSRTAFLKNIIKSPNIIVGDYTYYDDPVDVQNFEKMFFIISILLATNWLLANSVKAPPMLNL